MSDLTGLPDRWFPDLKPKTQEEEIEQILVEAVGAGKILPDDKPSWRAQAGKSSKAAATVAASLASLPPVHARKV